MPDTVDNNKLNKVLTKTLRIFNKNKLTIREIILAYGNLGYHLGASIAGFKSSGPSTSELNDEYYKNPTVDIGLMLQGLMITSWEEDFIKNPKLSDLAKKKGEK